MSFPSFQQLFNIVTTPACQYFLADQIHFIRLGLEKDLDANSIFLVLQYYFSNYHLSYYHCRCDSPYSGNQKFEAEVLKRIFYKR